MLSLSLGLGLTDRVVRQGYLPDALAGLRAVILGYWDAEFAPSITTSGSQVVNWRSTIGLVSPAQSIGGSRPLYNATGFNSRPGIVFDGIDDNLIFTGALPFPTGATPSTMWVLSSCPTGAVDTALRGLVVLGAASVNARRVRRSVSAGNSQAQPIIGNGTSAVVSTVTTPVFSGNTLLQVRVGATVTNANVNGGADSVSAVVPNSVMDQMIIGASSAGAQFWSGAINAIVITSELTAGQQTTLRNYLNGRL